MTEPESDDAHAVRAAEVTRIISDLNPDRQRWSGEKADDYIAGSRNHEITSPVLHGEAHADAPGDVNRVEAYAYDGAIEVLHDSEKPRMDVYVRLNDGTRFARIGPYASGREKLEALIDAVGEWETLDVDWHPEW